ncbi:MAG: hypothetical protein LBQ34_06965 [Alphaproteobacteria bacterium]|jgi:galactitol-specific phosphotransferase system IIB component|nr:hypothetical protein [Alphaproteobacteria bacterium]
MKILGVCEKAEDGLLLVHHIKSAIKDLGFINMEVDFTTELPIDGKDASIFVMNRDMASKCQLPNIMIIDNAMDYAEIKEKLKKLFIIYGFLDMENY